MRLGLLLLLVSASTASMLEGAIDLAYDSLDGISVTFPLHTKFKQTIKIRGEWGNSGLYLENNDILQGEHAGTHMDAPSHFIKGKWRIHEIPLEKFSGDAVVIDITEQAKKNRDALLEVEDLINWEKQHGPIPDGAIVVMYSGWGKYVNDTPTYLGIPPEKFAANPGDFSDMHYPGFSVHAAKWLVDNRNINGVAVDTVSLDYGPSASYPAHGVLLGANLWGIENMANVDQLRPSGDVIFAVPYNIHDGSGAPTRAFALPSEVFRDRQRKLRDVSASAASFVSVSLGLIFSLLAVSTCF